MLHKASPEARPVFQLLCFICLHLTSFVTSLIGGALCRLKRCSWQCSVMAGRQVCGVSWLTRWLGTGRSSEDHQPHCWQAIPGGGRKQVAISLWELAGIDDGHILLGGRMHLAQHLLWQGFLHLQDSAECVTYADCTAG